MTCPIKGVSKDCEKCKQFMYENCIYVRLWKKRKQGLPSKSSPYVPLDGGKDR